MLPRLAYALEHIERPGEALDIWQAHVQSETEIDPAARLRLQLYMGRLALRAKRFQEALVLLPEMREITATELVAETLFWRAEAHYGLQQWEVAKAQYQALVKRQERGYWGDAAQLRLGTVYEQQQEWDLALETYRALRDTTTDGEMIASAKRRIAAIEAGLVRSRPRTPRPDAGDKPKTPPSSEG